MRLAYTYKVYNIRTTGSTNIFVENRITPNSRAIVQYINKLFTRNYQEVHRF